MEASRRRDDLMLRLARASDSRLLWEWANEPAARANSFRPEPIAWAAHQEWFAARLASADCRIWIMEAGGHPVAQIRYERCAGDGARISYSVDAAARGRGFGVAVLERSFLLAVQALDVPWVSGVTFAENIASSQAFRRAGFELVDQQIIAGKSCQIFRRHFSLSHGDVYGAGH